MVYRSNKPRLSAHIHTVVTQEVKDALLSIADRRGVPYGDCVREAVDRWLEVVQAEKVKKTPQETS